VLATELPARPRRRRSLVLPVALLAVALLVLVVGVWPRADAGPPRLTVVASGVTPARIGDVASVYLVIDDDGGSDRLLSATSPMAATVTLHQTKTTSDRGDLMVDLSTLAVPARGQLALVPGGDHLMLHHVYESLDPGDLVTVTVTFERSGDMTLEVPVKPLTDLADLARLS
jgi:copper(I)-binding protein